MRFPQFTGEWETKKLVEVVDFKAGYAFKSQDMSSVERKYQLIKMSNVYKNELRLDRNPSYLEEIDDKLKEFLLKNGDTVLTLTGTVGKKDFGYSVMVTEDNKYLLNQRLVLLREKKGKSYNKFINLLVSDRRFLFYFFEESKGGTGNQANVGIDDIKNIQLNFPEIKEQIRISDFLLLVQERISTQNKIIEHLETLIIQCRRKIFNKNLCLLDKSIVSGWKEYAMGEILKFGNGKDYKHLNKGDVPVFGTGGLMTFVDDYLYEGETVCIGRKGTINKPIYHSGKIWTVDTLFFTHSFKNCVPKFIFHLFNIINWVEYNEASGVPSLSKSTIEKIKVQVPSINEQKIIVSFLDTIEQKIKLENITLEQFILIKKHLLSQMFV